MKLIYRVLRAVFLLPVIVAGIIPVCIIILDPWRQPMFFPGIVILVGGVIITAICIRDFYRRGRGTLAPWDAPDNLVVTGPYRLVRNPMYFGVLIVIVGLALLFTSPLLLVYNIAVAAAFHLRIVKYEEPELERQFGKRWMVYTAMTNRWLPKFFY